MLLEGLDKFRTGSSTVNISTEEQAEAGTDNTTLMTPLRTAQVVGDTRELANKNLLNILRLKLQQSLSASDIDAWSDLLANAGMINTGASNYYILSGGRISPTLQTETSTKNPGICTNDTSAGSADWTNPGNASISDNIYATCFLPLYNSSRFLKSGNYGFNLPENATIKGITVNIERKRGATSVQDQVVSLIDSSGTRLATNKSSGTIWPYDETIATYGGSADLWDSVWTAADINSANFGVSLQVQYGGSEATAYVDSIQIIVTYTYLPEATVIWNASTATEPLKYIAVTADQTPGTGTIAWYVSDDGTNWVPVELDTMTEVNFDAASVYLKCVLTGNATVSAVAWGGY